MFLVRGRGVRPSVCRLWLLLRAQLPPFRCATSPEDLICKWMAHLGSIGTSWLRQTRTCFSAPNASPILQLLSQYLVWMASKWSNMAITAIENATHRFAELRVMVGGSGGGRHRRRARSRSDPHTPTHASFCGQLRNPPPCSALTTPVRAILFVLLRVGLIASISLPQLLPRSCMLYSNFTIRVSFNNSTCCANSPLQSMS